MNHIETRTQIHRILKEVAPAKDTSMYPYFNSGRFGVRNTLELVLDASIELNAIEHRVHDHIQAFLNISDTVTVMDFGARCGLSLALLGAKFPKEVASGKLNLIATNKERNFSIIRALEESDRRLHIFPKLQRIIKEGQSLPHAHFDALYHTSIKQIGPILNPEEHLFLQKNYHRVQYIQLEANASARTMAARFSKIYPIHIVHEAYGGFHFLSYKQRRETMNTMSELFAPESFIFSQTKLPSIRSSTMAFPVRDTGYTRYHFIK